MKKRINKRSADSLPAISSQDDEKLFRAGALNAGKLPALLFLASLLFLAACEPAPSMMENKATPAPPPNVETDEKLSSLEREIRDMETADFPIVYVFKRKDGGVFDKEDKRYLSQNKPADANRFILTDDEKAFVAGSNYPFSAENLEALQKRFIVEDRSKPGAPTPIPKSSREPTPKYPHPVN